VSKSEALLNVLYKAIDYGERLLAASWRTVPCQFLAAAYLLYSQLPSIAGGRSSVRNPKMCHAVVTGTHLTFSTQMLFRCSESELFDTFTNVILFRIFPLSNIYS
jgi:hypothetical protein